MDNQKIVRDKNRIRSKKRRLLQNIANESLNDKPCTSDNSNSELRYNINLSEGNDDLKFSNNNNH